MTPLHFRIIFFEVGALLLVAISDLPFDFYKPLRITVAAASVLLIVRAKKIRRPGWYLPAGLAILLFTPGFGFTFPKATWMPIDIVFGLFFISAAVLTGKPFELKGSELPDDDGRGNFSAEAKQTEWNKPNVFWAIITVTAIIGVLFAYFGSNPGEYTGCPNWVQDGHGGYCEG